jgi:hypothetical protein
MLQDHKKIVFNNFIRSLLKHEILSINQFVFSAIVSLKRAHYCKTLFKKQFRDWWKQNHFYKIKTKSLSIIRFELDHQRTMINWFSKYKIVLKALNIRKKRNILNVDEIDFRTKYIKSQEIIILIEIKKHYQIRFENRKSIIIIKMINAVNDYFLSLIIIIQKQDIMISWFDDVFSEEMYVIFSKSNFISNKIAFDFWSIILNIQTLIQMQSNENWY